MSVPTVVGDSDAVPEVDWVPLQEPLAVHDVAFVEDHVSTADPPTMRLVGAMEMVTVGAGLLGLPHPLPAPNNPINNTNVAIHPTLFARIIFGTSQLVREYTIEILLSAVKF